MGFLTAMEGKPLSSEILATTYGTSPVVVRRLLAKLSEAGLIHSQRGVGGGSALAQEPESINLRDVYEAVVERSEIFPRYPVDKVGPSKVLGSYVNDMLCEAEEDLLARFEKVSIYEMDQQVRPAICKLLKKANKSP